MIRICQITFFLTFFNLIFAQTEYIYVLGNVQDAGLPHIGCQHKFCKEKFSEFEEYFTTSIAVVDPLEKKYILAIGRLTNQKNFLELIKSFEIISKKNPEYLLIILGDGEERYKLTNQIKSLKLENKLFLLGFEEFAAG